MGTLRLLHGRGIGERKVLASLSLHVPPSLCLLPRLPSKSFPHLPGTPRPAPSAPPGSVKAAPAQARPPSPGNIRPIKREVRVEPERKDPDKEPQKVANESSLKARAPLVKVEEATVEDTTPVEPEATPGRSQLTWSGVWVAGSLYSVLLFPCT